MLPVRRVQLRSHAGQEGQRGCYNAAQELALAPEQIRRGLQYRAHIIGVLDRCAPACYISLLKMHGMRYPLSQLVWSAKAELSCNASCLSPALDTVPALWWTPALIGCTYLCSAGHLQHSVVLLGSA